MNHPPNQWLPEKKIQLYWVLHWYEGVPTLMSEKHAGIDSKSAHSIERTNSNVQIPDLPNPSIKTFETKRTRHLRIEWFKRCPRFKTPQREPNEKGRSVICDLHSFTYWPIEPAPADIRNPSESESTRNVPAWLLQVAVCCVGSFKLSALPWQPATDWWLRFGWKMCNPQSLTSYLYCHEHLIKRLLPSTSRIIWFVVFFQIS